MKILQYKTHLLRIDLLHARPDRRGCPLYRLPGRDRRLERHHTLRPRRLRQRQRGLIRRRRLRRRFRFLLRGRAAVFLILVL